MCVPEIKPPINRNWLAEYRYIAPRLLDVQAVSGPESVAKLPHVGRVLVFGPGSQAGLEAKTRPTSNLATRRPFEAELLRAGLKTADS